MHRKILTLIMTAAATVPAGTTMAATTHAKPKPVKPKTYKGPVVDMRWGPVQATIVVKGKKITDVKIGTAPENVRSQLIDEQAVPLLRQETLEAQNAQIDEISGATMTSDAFIESLQAALVKAHLAKAAN
jgi:uncharacterized protein with FMN-binding domain